MHVTYSETENSLYTNSSFLSETKFPYLHWTERHLQVMWWEQKYFKNLKTNEGLPIEIISPGIWNSEAGPDFLKAHLKIGDHEFKGDIEIHLNDESWMHHGHHMDARYDQVILHVSLYPPQAKKEVISSKGRQIFQTHLEKFLTISQSRILQLIDLDQYPYRKFLGSGHCSQNLFSQLPEEKVFELFQSAAEWRLMQKANYIKGRVDDQSLWLPAGIAMALGYKLNTESFFELFLRLLKYKDRSEQELLALGLGITGFFAPKFQNKWRASSTYKALEAIYHKLSPYVPHVVTLTLNQIRPLNHPVRRIAYLVKLMKDPLMGSIYKEICLCWHQNWPSACLQKDWVQLREKLTDRIPSYEDPYWNQHFTFEKEMQNVQLPLVGKGFKENVLVNTVLPLLFFSILQKNNPSETSAFREFYKTIPANYSNKANYISHRFFGDQSKGQILQKAQQQQGAFQIYEDFCSHHEASCEGCNFIEQYAQNKKSDEKDKKCKKIIQNNIKFALTTMRHRPHAP